MKELIMELKELQEELAIGGFNSLKIVINMLNELEECESELEFYLISIKQKNRMLSNLKLVRHSIIKFNTDITDYKLFQAMLNSYDLEV